MGCLIKHKWVGCQCIKCGATRDEGHNWSRCSGKCLRCGKPCEVQHCVIHCRCEGCGQYIHKWDGCTCTACGETRGEGHSLDVCVCTRCGAKPYRDKPEKLHAWDGCKCTKCGAKRDEGHVWKGCKCTKCGAERDEGHVMRGCLCTRCGKVRHEWDGGKCRICGAIDKESIMNAYVEELLTIYPRQGMIPEEVLEWVRLYHNRTIAIGKTLNELGGFLCMETVWRDFSKKRPMYSLDLKAEWDGIGSWKGYDSRR